MLIEGLPPESATWTAIRNATPESDTADATEEARPETAPWSRLEMLVAQVTDAVNHNTYVLTVVNSEKNAKVQPPDPVRRPGWRPQGAKRQAAPSSAAAWAKLDAMLSATA